MRTVSIIQRRLTHYRVPLFDQMRSQLQDMGIRLRLLHGTGTDEELRKRDSASLDWAEVLPTRYLLGGRVCWQPFMSRVRDSDLVVVTQENKLVNNLPLLYSHRRHGPRLAFWGHGKNLQSTTPNGGLERIKRHQTRRVDWWFAYTEMSAGFVRDAGFPADKITVVNNSVDTRELALAVARSQATPLIERRRATGLHAGPVGAFIGSLYAGKRVDFLIQAAARIRERVPQFQLLVVGDGPDRDQLHRLSSQYQFVQFAGSAHGQTKADLLSCADLLLNPGLLGLVVLDAFVTGLPIVCCSSSLNAPESHYVEHGLNGLVLKDDLDSYVDGVVSLLDDGPRLESLAHGAKRSGEIYSVEEMCQRFCRGISQALQCPR